MVHLKMRYCTKEYTMVGSLEKSVVIQTRIKCPTQQPTYRSLTRNSTSLSLTFLKHEIFNTCLAELWWKWEKINAKIQNLTHSRPSVIGISNYYQTEFTWNHSGISQNNTRRGTATTECTKANWPEKPTGTVETGPGRPLEQ